MDTPLFKSHHITVVGDVMLDQYWSGKTQRISPEAPVPIVTVTDQHAKPGGAANVAANLQALGCHTTLLGLIGEDPKGEQLKQLLDAQGIHHQLSTHPHNPTTTKLRIQSQDQQIIRLDFEEVDFLSEATELKNNYTNTLRSSHLIILSDYAKGVLNDPQFFIQQANAQKIPTLIDPKHKDWSVYRGAYLLTPNKKEFEDYTQHPCDTIAELSQLGNTVRTDLNLHAVLITLGKQGMLLLEQNQEPLHIPAQTQEVFNVTGAGDTVIATMATAIANDYPLHTAAQWANVAAGIAISQLETAAVSQTQLCTALQKSSPTHTASHHHTRDTLATARQQAASREETVVMTNGCFDILHAGHITYLQQAKALGHRLIVAVNDDASVSKLKGPTRPYNSLEHRMLLLSALDCVDWVIPFSEETPQALIDYIQPDVLVKGGDYQVHDIAGHESVLERGGRVEILPFVDGLSTTQLIHTIQQTEEASS